MERVERIELSTYSLGSCRSATELHPHWHDLYRPLPPGVKFVPMASATGRFALRQDLLPCAMADGKPVSTFPDIALAFETDRSERFPMDESQTFAQLVQARLADDILNGSLEPGSKLKLQALCETYEVSMSPLREALARLTGRGLVFQEGQRGFRVAEASFDDLRDVTETRIHIETTALCLAMERGGDEWEATVLAAHHRLARRLRSKDLLVDAAWETLHRGYHMALIEACGLPRLLDICTGLHDHFDRYRRLAVLHANRHPKLRSSHAAIVKFTLARDAERAVALLTEHIQESSDQFAGLLKSEGASKLLKTVESGRGLSRMSA